MEYWASNASLHYSTSLKSSSNHSIPFFSPLFEKGEGEIFGRNEAESAIEAESDRQNLCQDDCTAK